MIIWGHFGKWTADASTILDFHPETTTGWMTTLEKS